MRVRDALFGSIWQRVCAPRPAPLPFGSDRFWRGLRPLNEHSRRPPRLTCLASSTCFRRLSSGNSRECPNMLLLHRTDRTITFLHSRAVFSTTLQCKLPRLSRLASTATSRSYPCVPALQTACVVDRCSTTHQRKLRDCLDLLRLPYIDHASRSGTPGASSIYIYIYIYLQLISWHLFWAKC